MGLAWLHEAARGFTGQRINDLGHQAWIGFFEPLRAAAEALKPGLAATIEADWKQWTTANAYALNLMTAGVLRGGEPAYNGTPQPIPGVIAMATQPSRVA